MDFPLSLIISAVEFSWRNCECLAECLVRSKCRMIFFLVSSPKKRQLRTDMWLSYRAWCVHIVLDVFLGVEELQRTMNHWPLLHLAPTLNDIWDSDRDTVPWEALKMVSLGQVFLNLDPVHLSSWPEWLRLFPLWSSGKDLWAWHKFRSAHALKYWAG